MPKQKLDGKTYYYLMDENYILHVCSDGVSSCGLDAKSFAQVEDAKLKLYSVCEKCLPTKTATFETKAEIVEIEPATGKII